MEKGSEKDPLKYSTKENLRYMYRNWMDWDKNSIWICIFRVPALVLLPMLTVLIPTMMMQFIQQNRSVRDMVVGVSLMSLAIAGLSWIDPFLQNYMKSHSEKIQNTYRIAAFNKMMELPYADIESMEGRERNERGQRFASSWWGGARALFDCLVLLAVNVVGIVSYLALLSKIHPALLGLILLSCVGDILLLTLARKYQDKFFSKNSKFWMRWNYMYEKSHDFEAGKDIRIYSLSDWFIRILAEANKGYIKLLNGFTRQQIKVTAGRAMLSMLRDAVAYIYLIYCVLEQGMDVSMFIFNFGLITGFAAWLLGISSQTSHLKNICIECDRYRRFMETDSKQQDTAEDHPLPTAEELPCSIVFEDVSFTYQGAEEETIHAMNFGVAPGDNIAIVGENGAGKTTAIKLLCGFYKPTKGRILINGVDASRYRTEAYYSLFSAVFQDYNFLPMSIEANITLTEHVKVDQMRMEQVAEKAGILERLRRLPKAFDTLMVKEVHEDATDFSGGEVQKLLLARALYKDAPILVLDEPTAALDPIAENELYERYSALTKGKTSFFISHRLSSTRFCDRILFISDGRISEEGTHDELMAKKGRYWQMFQVQSHYYREGSDA